MWASTMKLNPNTASELIRLGFDSMEAISMIEKSDMPVLNIPLGQQNDFNNSNLLVNDIYSWKVLQIFLKSSNFYPNVNFFNITDFVPNTLEGQSKSEELVSESLGGKLVSKSGPVKPKLETLSKTKKRCAQALAILIALLRKLGFCSWSKVTDPCQQIVFLGVEIDSTTLETRLPTSKLHGLKSELAELLLPKHVPGKTNILADCISRMHDLPFCEQFLRDYVQPPLYLQDLVRHMSSNALRFLLFRLTGIKGECTLEIPLSRVKNSHLCPSKALLLNFKQVTTVSSPSPVFLYLVRGKVTPLTYTAFVKMLKQNLSRLGYDSSKYSGNSFRRGGASFALECGVPADLIQSQGGCKSNAYKSYLDPSFAHRKS
ncbi:unnamed protein product [Mytilus coruscus]|uniref:Tyr recombinase domain-containing protein n=1 Tax=Mytilus coruscus TaxID=42192 RepID=A0A6J8BK92_MYTCO|nr:unnamed protein product [Mytilus coruscus]